MARVEVALARLSLLIAFVFVSVAQGQPAPRPPVTRSPAPTPVAGAPVSAAFISRVVSVDSASRALVSLSWKSDESAGTKFVVERKTLGSAWPVGTTTVAASGPATPAAIATVDATKIVDTQIDAFTTYVYRVRALGTGSALSAPSTEVIVGPPPVGFSSVISAPKAMQEHDASQFGDQIRMAFDANGDPMLSYITFDLNLDGEAPDSELRLITWNRARYRWNAPVAIDTVANVTRSGTRTPVSLARDPGTGQIGVLYLMADRDLRLATSDDGGATWKKSVIEHSGADDPGFSTPVLAMGAGKVHLAYAKGSNNVLYRSGAMTAAPSGWSTKSAPKLPETDEARAECIAIALDAGGKPGVSYCMSAMTGYNLIMAFWKPESGAVVKLADTNNKQNDDPAIQISSAGNETALVFSGGRDEQFFANHHIWFTHSKDGGATWSPMVVIADDGGNAMGAPVSTSIDKAGHFAVFAQMNGGNEGGVKCGLPKLMRSMNGSVWTTCA